MCVACVDAHWGAGPLHTGLSVALVSGLAVRGEDWDWRPLLVSNEVAEGVLRIGPTAGSVGAHMRVVVDVLGLRDFRLVHGSRVGRSVQAEAAPVSAMLDILCLVSSVARDDVA